MLKCVLAVNIDKERCFWNIIALSIPSVPISPPPPPGICRAFVSLVGPGGGEFVIKRLPGIGALVNSSRIRSGERRFFFNISLENMPS